MALLPYGDENKDASPETLKALGRPFMLNVAKMIANSEPCFKAFGQLGGALFNQAKLDPKLREIAILKTAKASHSVYEWTQHVPAARHVGVTEEQIAAIEHWRAAKCFSELERLVMQLTDEVAINVKGKRETVEALKQHLSPAEIVELILTIGNWGMVARLLETLEVDLEPFAGQYNILERQPRR
jgi:4-carboxymuconolactone decarboxylase